MEPVTRTAGPPGHCSAGTHCQYEPLAPQSAVAPPCCTMSMPPLALAGFVATVGLAICSRPCIEAVAGAPAGGFCAKQKDSTALLGPCSRATAAPGGRRPDTQSAGTAHRTRIKIDHGVGGGPGREI